MKREKGMMKNEFLTAATIGFFDGVHCGHQYLIDEVKRLAQARGLKSMVITFDLHPRQGMERTAYEHTRREEGGPLGVAP